MLSSDSLLLDVMSVLYLLDVVYRLLEEVVMSMTGEVMSMCVLSLVLVRYDVELPHVCLSYDTTYHSLSCVCVC